MKYSPKKTFTKNGLKKQGGQQRAVGIGSGCWRCSVISICVGIVYRQAV